MDVKKHLKFLKEVKSHLKRHKKLPSQPYKKTNQKFKKGGTLLPSFLCYNRINLAQLWQYL